MLTFRSKTGLNWQSKLKAARLVDSTGTAGLPAPIGDVKFELISDPTRLGLPTRHPVQDRYPHIKIVHYAMVVEERFLVERGGVRGIALYADYNGSDLSAAITSENGRNPLAPMNWEGAAGTPTDPAATAALEWRSVSMDGQEHRWHNASIHGWPGWDGRDQRLDWRDGVPVDVKTMYDREQGKVAQSIMVPVGARGLGLAEQTLARDEVKEAYSVLLFFPREQAAKRAKALQSVWHDPTAYRGGTRGGRLEGLASSTQFLGGETTRGSRRTQSLEPEALRGTPIQTEYKMAAGGLIRQHIIENPFGPAFWSEPEALLVCHAVSEEQARSLFSAQAQTGRSHF